MYPEKSAHLAIYQKGLKRQERHTIWKKQRLPKRSLMSCAVYYGDKCLLVSSQGDREQD